MMTLTEFFTRTDLNSIKSEVDAKAFFGEIELLAKGSFQYTEDITRMAEFGSDACFSSEKALREFKRLSVMEPVWNLEKKRADAYILSLGFNDENGKFHPKQIWGFWNP